MNTLLQFPDRRARLEQATAWIIKLERGLHDGEREELFRWLDGYRNRETLLEIANLWDRVDMLAELAELFPLRDETIARRRVMLWSAVAAASVLLGFGLTMLNFFRAAHFSHSYATAIGEQRTIELPDHSKILLNTNTDLQVDFSAAGRLVKLRQGEADFEVEKDPTRPFTVRTGGIDIVAVGTTFNVRNDAVRGVSLTVIEGRVHVHDTQPVAAAHADKIVAAPTEVAHPDLDVMVGASSGVVIDPATKNMRTLAVNEVAGATAWQQGMAVFDHTPLRQVAADFNRYLSTPIVIVDPELGDLPVSGFFKTGDVDALAIALKKNFDIDVERKNNEIKLTYATE